MIGHLLNNAVIFLCTLFNKIVCSVLGEEVIWKSYDMHVVEMWTETLNKEQHIPTFSSKSFKLCWWTGFG